MNKSRTIVGLLLGVTVIWLVPANAGPPGACTPWPQCKGGDDSGSSEETTTLYFQPRDFPDGAGLLTTHIDHGDPNYSIRNDAPGCPAEFNDMEWPITFVRDASKKTGDVVFVADGDDLIIDLLAHAVGLDGCYGATAIDNGRFELRKRLVGRRKEDQTCSGSIDWDFDYADTQAGIKYLTLQSVGPNNDAWIELLPVPHDPNNPNASDLCNVRSDVAVLIDSTFQVNETTAGNTVTNGIINLAFYVVFD